MINLRYVALAPNRTWVYAPSKAILGARWTALVAEQDRAKKTAMFKPTPSTDLLQSKTQLPGSDTIDSGRAFDSERASLPGAVPVGYRFLDRQWIIPDARLMHRPRADLWAARIPGQVFIVELHSQAITDGPGAVFSALIPDMHHFKGSEGGRSLPLVHPGGLANIANGLLEALSTLVGGALFDGSASADDILAYIAAIVAHPAYTKEFADELTTPGVRIPITADPQLWAEAVELGKTIVWVHTFGQHFADDPERPVTDIRYPVGDGRRITNTGAVTGMPASLTYGPDSETISLGSGTWRPVSQAVADYSVGGKNVTKSWFAYRRASPGGKKSSPLDYIHVDAWPAAWSREFSDVLTAITRLVEAEPAQADLLDRILAGSLITKSTLAAHGVRWPSSPKHRRPQYDAPPGPAVEQGGQLSFGE